MMFTPCGPSAVPTGGAGFAAPAGHWSFTTATTFLAILLPLTKGRLARYRRLCRRSPCGRGLMPSELQVIQLHRRRPPEQRDRHFHFALLRQHLFDRPAEIGEGALGDLHRLTDQVGDLFLGPSVRRLLDHAERSEERRVGKE